MHETGRQGWAWRCGVLMLGALLAPAAADASTYRWQSDASGNWNDPARWALVEGPAGAGYPNLAGDVAVFDVAPTADRTVTIPDGVTITIGRLEFDYDSEHRLTVSAGGGAATLVFDNLGEDAVIEANGEASRSLMPLRLEANLVFTGTGSGVTTFVETSGISESGGSRTFTQTGGRLLAGGVNTYTGITTVVNGSYSTHDNDAIRIPGDLIVGDSIGASRSAFVSVFGQSIAPTANVTVLADGGFTTGKRIFGSGNLSIGNLTVVDGYVSVFRAGSQLSMTSLTMQGGQLSPASNASFRVTGSVTATSTAAGPARIEDPGLVTGFLTLAANPNDLTIADGPQAIDFIIGVPLGTEAAGAAVRKLGPGVARLTGSSVLINYAGPTSILGGTLLVDVPIPFTAVSVDAAATLGGTGAVGSIAAATNGTVLVGGATRSGLHGTLESGPVAFNGATVAFDISGGVAGTFDQLVVTGTVDLGNSTLSLTSSLVLPPTATFTIIDNDAADAVVGTFAGLPEGATVTTPSGGIFTISYQGGDGNDVVLANLTPVTYFLSEGATGTFFDEDVLIVNPNSVAAPVTLTFFLPGGGTVVEQVSVPANRRLTVDVDEIEGLQNTSPSVQVRSDDRLTLGVERTMFWDSTHYGGHTANSVASAERQWLFAEGAQNDFFNTYLLLANPSGAMTATVTFLRESEPPFVLEVPLAAQSRTTVSAGDHAELVGRSFGIVVDAPTPITAERAMYFATTPQRLWSGGHDNVGSPAPATSWFHPEGASGTFFTTFILMGNPQNTPANVTMRFLLQSGDPIEITKTIGAQQRLTINPAAEGRLELQNASFSTVVTSDVPIVSERAMYWNTDDTFFGEGHASSGLTTVSHEWLLAEGRVGGANAYTTYILLANPGASVAQVEVSFLREGAANPVVKTVNVQPNSRFNVDVGTMVPELQNESFGALIRVPAGPAIAVERSMYWNVDGRFWSGGTNAVGTVVPF